LESPDRSERVEASAALGREGLPPSYRMRADRHYVEQLEETPAAPAYQLLPLHLIEPAARVEANASDESTLEAIRHHGLVTPLVVQSRGGRYRLLHGGDRLALATSARLREVPCVVYQVDDAAAARLADAASRADKPPAAADAVPGRTEWPSFADAAVARELSAALGVISRCIDLGNSEGTSSLARHVAADLTRCELDRAAWVLEGIQFLRRDRAIVRQRTAIAVVLERVRIAWEAEGRLRRTPLALEDDPPLSLFDIDAEAVACALRGIVTALAHLQKSQTGAGINLSATAAGAVVALTVSVRETPSAEWSARAFDPSWAERPGGVSAALGLHVARAVADAHQGSVAVSISKGAAVTLTIGGTLT
jgi:hypothetical protein